MDPPWYGSRPAILPMLMISPEPPSEPLALKIGRMAWVTLIRPVTLVENMMSMSSSAMLGACATPFTSPLQGLSQKRMRMRRLYPPCAEGGGRGRTFEETGIEKMKHRAVDIRVVYQNMNVSKLLGQARNKSANFLRFADVELHREDLDAIAHLGLDIRRQLFQRIDAAGGQDEPEVDGGCPCELEGAAPAYSGRRAGDDHGLTLEPPGCCRSRCCRRHGSGREYRAPATEYRRRQERPKRSMRLGCRRCFRYHGLTAMEPPAGENREETTHNSRRAQHTVTKGNYFEGRGAGDVSSNLGMHLIPLSACCEVGGAYNWTVGVRLNPAPPGFRLSVDQHRTAPLKPSFFK